MLTNKYNLPEPIPTIIAEGGHEPVPNRYSVTDLLGPPLIRTLKHEHYADLGSDCSDYLWMLLGTSLDNLLTSNLPKSQAQIKMEHEVEGCTVVGVADVIRDDVIEDWKVTSVYTLSNQERIQEWAHQLNFYAWLRDMNQCLPTRYIKIHAYLRDWVATKAQFDPKYPRCQLHTLNLTPMLLDPAGREQLVLERLADHVESPRRECTPAEKWEKPTTYAVKKKGQKKALRVLDTEEEAQKWLVAKDTNGLFIETRPGACMRCSSYCAVSSHCPYYEEK